MNAGGPGGLQDTRAPLDATITAGPLRVRLALDASLASVFAGSTLSRARATEGDCGLTLRLRTGSGAARGTPLGFDGESLTAAGCRLTRRAGAPQELFDGECEAAPQALARAVRFATQPALLDRGWLLLHASSVLVDGRAHVFVAASGTGKSTLARRLVAAGATLVADEVTLVCEARCAAHPGQLQFGDVGATHELAAVHLLARGTPSARRLSPARAIAALLRHAMVYEQGGPAAQRALAGVEAIASRVPVFETQVPDDERAVSLFEGRFDEARPR